MANIMITDKCNLNCRYCFANEFVNQSDTDISVENFKKALDFVATEPIKKLGIIGGEPTLHKNFKELLQILINDDRFSSVLLFTNGIRINEYVNELTHPKFHILLNCNCKDDIGETLYKRMCDNLQLLIESYYMKDRITLGINIYKKDFQYDYILDLLKKYGYHHVRMSIVVPNMKDQRSSYSVHDYFCGIKPRFKEFIYDLLSNGILPTYDCNKMPSCLIEDNQMADIKHLLDKKVNELSRQSHKKIKLPMDDSAIYTDYVHCSPVIDIRQDLTAVRCFGLSDCTKVSIGDFKSITDLGTTI